RGREHAWRVVGVCQMAGDVEPGFAYVNYDALVRVLGEVGRAADFHVVTAAQDEEAHARVAQALEERFRQAGIPVLSITTGSELRAQQSFGIDIFVTFMLMLAGLIALVGGLGLAGTMSMNVLERTREIGVMRAIGASNGAIRQLVIVEGLTIGALSWLLGAALAAPISRLFNAGVGIVFFSVPLAPVFSWTGFLVWLAVAMILSALASLLPARSASRLTIREVLAYE
ncbi:MAG: ABC transporter permease, partial [Anaerolineae bacterium]|nr:ABC transporter permease [Anaerolineae bacterium]